MSVTIQLAVVRATKTPGISTSARHAGSLPDTALLTRQEKILASGVILGKSFNLMDLKFPICEMGQQ